MSNLFGRITVRAFNTRCRGLPLAAVACCFSLLLTQSAAAVPVITSQPVSAVVTNGQATSLSVTNTGTVPLSYQWLKDGVMLSGKTNRTLSLGSFKFTDSGSYSVVITDVAQGMTISRPASLSIPNAPLRAWGDNHFGQLGNGTTNNANRTVQVASNVVTAAAGYSHSLFVKADGTLWSMGDNHCGQLGNGTTNNANWPVLVASNVVTAAGGAWYSMFVKADGTLWAMGDNGEGQLGYGRTGGFTNRPVQVASNVVAVAASDAHSLFIKADGTLWAMGDNSDGQLGNGANVSTNRPIQVASNVVSVAGGWRHSLFVKADGTLWTMGYNGSGQLGTGENLSTNRPVRVATNVVSAAGGSSHSLFVKADGTLWAMGYNGSGQLGYGTSFEFTMWPIRVASNVVATAGGCHHSLFVKTDGTLWAMGLNNSAQLGNGTTDDFSNLPVQVTGGLLTASLAKVQASAFHSLAIAGAAPAATVSNLTVTVGQTAILTASVTGDGLFTYQWQFNGTNIVNATNATYTIASTALSHAGHYAVAVAGTYGATTSADATLTVKSIPNVMAWPTASPITLGRSLASSTLSGGTGSVAGAFVFTVPGTVPTGTASQGVTFTPTDTNSYSSVTGSVSVTVIPPPTITAQPESAVVTIGQATSLSVTNNGTGPFRYQWIKDGVILAGQTNSTLSFAPFKFIDSGSYSVVITDDAQGMTISIPANLSTPNAPLQAWGNNDWGQLGSDRYIVDLPITMANNVVAAAGGSSHSLFVKVDGTLWATGYNGYGQLGNGTTGGYIKLPVQVASNVVSAAGGWLHSLFVKADGTLWAMGLNNNGQLGVSTPTGINNLPIQVSSNVVAAAGGSSHSLFVKADGTLWAMGANGAGELGNGTTYNVNPPVQVASNVVAVAAGSSHSLFVKADGTLWSMGDNYYGQLGNGTTANTNRPIQVASNVVAAAAGSFHSLFVKADATLWAMGQNNSGQLGNGTTNNANRPVQVASNVVAAAGGISHTVIVKADGTLWAMGSNYYGQLGTGTWTSTNLPVQISGVQLTAGLAKAPMADYSLAIAGAAPTATVSNLTVTVGQTAILTASVTGDGLFTYQWQFNGTNIVNATNATYTIASTALSHAGHYAVAVAGTYGATTSADATLTVNFVITVQPVSAVVAVGQAASLSVSNSGLGSFSYQWVKDGVILSGQTNNTLSISSFMFTDSGSYYVVITNAMGMAISRPANLSVPNAPLQAWGYNSCGQLGNGTTADTNRPVSVATNVVSAAGGLNHSVFVKADGTLWAMGDNTYGQLGNGTTTQASLPVQVASNVVATAGGREHSLFVKADGTLWAMGQNNYGQLGNGTTGGSANRPVLVASNVVSAACGYFHSLFVKADGTLWAMGFNDNGRLGNGTTTHANLPVQVANHVVAAASGNDHSLFVKADGTLWAMGANSLGQLGNGTTTQASLPIQVASHVVAAAAGYAHTLFVKADGTLWAMGNNDVGQLGNGTTNNADRPVLVSSNVVAAAGGVYHTLFVKADSTLWAMGKNDCGQLGNGTTANTNLPVLINGGGLMAVSIAKGSTVSHALAIAGALPAATISVRTDPSGQTTYITASVTGDGPFTYQWQLNGTNIVNATNASYAIVSATVSQADHYAVVVAGLCGNTTTTLAEVMAPPVITAQPVSAVTTMGLAASLSVSNSGTAPFGYQWLKDGVILSGQTNRTLSFSVFKFTDSGSYSVVITNPGAMVISMPANLSVPNAPLRVWGNNESGPLGNGQYGWAHINQPVQVASNVVAAAGGGGFSLFVKADRTLWAMGFNYYGQLGNDSTLDAHWPVQVTSNVVAAAGGGSHSLFVKADGTLWAMGLGAWGQLGNGYNYLRNPRPEQVASNVVAAAAGGSHSLFIKADGTLWGMGPNWDGQLGNNTAGAQYYWPVKVASNVVAAAGGYAHTLFIKADGTLWGIGLNNKGQLGVGTTNNFSLPVQVASNVVAAVGGVGHSLFVKADGTLWAMGANSLGQLGNGTTNNANWPVQVASNVTAVTTGFSSSLFVKVDGTLWAMGDNFYGQLGNGTWVDTNLPVQVTGNLLAASLAKNPHAKHTLVIAGTLPVASISSSQAVTVGQTANFTASVTGGAGPFTYQWQLNGVTIVNATNNSYVIASAAPSDAGNYAVVVAAAYGTTTSTVAILTVSKATPDVITWPTPLDLTFGQTLAASTLGGGMATVAGAFAFTTPSTVPAAGTSSQGVTFTPTDTNSYNSVAGSVSVTVNKASQTMTFPAISAPVTTQVVGLTATTSSGLPAVFRVLSGSASISGGTNLSFSGAGSVSIVTSQAGNSNYNAAPSVTNTFSVTKAVAAVSLSNTNQTYDGTAKSVTVTTVPAGRTVSVTYNSSATVPVGGGSYTVVAAVNEAMYQGGTTGTLMIAKASQTVSFQNIGDQLTTNIVALSATASSGLSVTTFSVLSGPALISAGSVSFTNSGNVTLRAVQDGSASYNASATNISFNVSKVLASVSLSNTNQTYDGTAKSVTVTTVPSNLTVVATYNGSATAPTNAACYVVVATASEAMYQGGTTGTLTIAKGVPIVAVWPSASTIMNGQPLAASTLSGGACSVDGAFAFTTPETIPAEGTDSQGVIFTPADTGSYTSVTGSVNVTVGDLPAIAARPVSAVVTIGQATSLSVTSSGTVPFSYQWLKDNVILSGQTNRTLSFSSFKFTDSGSYSVVITNTIGMAISLPASLSVPNAPLRCWGRNDYGQLGNGTRSNSCLPVQVASNVVVATAGQAHSLFVKANGTLWAMGYNNNGQLGNGITGGYIAQPVQVASNVVVAAAGQSHSLFVKTDGTLWTMGYNNYGQLGIGTTGGSVNRPMQVASNVVAVAAGYYHSLFVKADGTLWAMGYNANSRLGNGTITHTNRPIQVASNVVTVASGNDHSLFVKANDTLWTMGANNLGQLGIGTTNDASRPVLVTNNVAAVAAGYAHSLVIKADGTLWGMGNNGDGELGYGTATVNRPVLVTSDVVATAGGAYHSLFVKADGTLWAIGYNANGQLGDGTWTAASQPVQVNGGGLIAVSIAKGSTASHSLSIAGALPAVTVSNLTVTVGQMTNFTASVTDGDGPFTYQWQMNGTNIGDATNAIYTIGSAVRSHVGNYAVVVVGACGSTTSTVATLTVNKATPNVTTWPTASDLMLGQTLAASVLSNGAGSVDGAFAFTTPGTVPAAGTSSQNVTFTPIDTSSYNSVAGSVSVTVNKANQTMTFPAISAPVTTQVVGLTATTSSGLPAVFRVLSGSASISGGTNLSFSGAGSVSIVTSQAGNSNYNAAPSVTNTFSVTKAVAAVSLSNTNQTYDGTAKSVTVTTVPAGRTVSVTYNSSATVPVGGGSYTVVAAVNEAMYQGGTTGTLMIAKASQTVSFQNIGDQLTTNIVALSATASSGLSVTTFSVVSGPAVISFGRVSFTTSGSVTLRAVQDGSASYNASAVTNISFSVTKAQASVSLSNTNQTYDGTAKSVAVTTVPAGRMVNVTYNSFATLPVNVGSYTVVATVNEALYQGEVTGLLTIAKASQTLSFENIGDQLTTNIVTLSATATSGLSVTNFNVVSGPALISAGSVSFTNSGSVTLSAVQDGNADYDASAVTNISFSVTKAVAEVSLSNTNQAYDGTAKSVTVTTVPVGQTVNVTYNSSSTVPTNAASYTVVATISEAMYQGGTTGTLTISKASQMLSFENIGDQLTTNVVTLSAIATSGLTVTNFSVVSGPALISAGNVSFTNSGNVTLSAVQDGNADYDASATTNFTFSVTKAVAEVSLSNTNQTYDGTAKSVTVTTVPAGRMVSVTYNNFATVPSNAASYAVVATISEAMYQGGTMGTLTIAKASQTITFPAISTKVMTDTVELLATASSSLPVSFVLASGPANLADLTNLTFKDMGSVSIVASQAGDSNYNAAPNVTNIFMVSKVTPNVTIWPTASDLMLGQTLAASVLSGGTSSVAGVFAFTEPETVPAAGTASQGVIFTPADTGNYNSVTGSVSVTVVVPPAITAQPVGAVVTTGQEVSLSVSNSGSVPLGYQWIKDGVILSGQTNSTLNFSSFKFIDSGSYAVVITNSGGMTMSLPASLSTPNAPLRVWGRNNYGQLGNGTNVDTSLPITVASNVVATAGGGFHSLFVNSDGTLWAMGYNNRGQLGNGTTGGSTNRPVQVASTVVAAAGGIYHSLFVKADGTLWAMGQNSDGQLGNGTTANTNRPVQVASNVVAVAGGGTHSLFVKADGTLWAMGNNNMGQLGNGTTNNADRPVLVSSNVVATAGGSAHSLFVKADGTLWAMGQNSSGQLGNGTTASTNLPVQVASHVVAAAGGYTHSLFIKAYGTLWAMGHNNYGQLGNGTTANTNRPVQVASNMVAAIGGNTHALFVKKDGTLWAMGQNSYGQLGNDSVASTNLPVQVSGGLLTACLAKEPMSYHSLAIAGALPVASVSNRTVEVGQTAIFMASVTGDGPFTYQWQFNGTNILDATNASYSVDSATLTDAGAYAVTVSSFVGNTSQSASLTVNPALATLEIRSPFGMGTPAVGFSTNTIGAVLTNSMANPEPAGGTQYVCTGWSMVGNEPASGTTNQFVMSATNNAVLTWLWTTNYYLNTAAGPNGSVTIDSGWQPMGVTMQLTAIAAQYYHFAAWSGDASGGSNPVELLMNAPKSVTATFAANVTTTHPTPEAWLARHGITSNFDQNSLEDADHDGLANWQEYIAGTDPTNAASKFQITQTQMGGVVGTHFVIRWSSVAGKLYAVDATTNLLEGFPLNLGSDILATPSENIMTIRVDRASQQFYRIRVQP